MPQQRDPHDCWDCGKFFSVIYEAGPEERSEAVPVSCPHCGMINHLPVARGAVAARDYRTEKDA